MMTLSDLKRHLSKGVAVQRLPVLPLMHVIKYVVKVQTNGVYLNADKNATTGSWLDFPKASLLDVNEHGFTIYTAGRRPLNDAEKSIIANEPKDKKQSKIDLVSDGNVMFYRLKNYYEEADALYLFSGCGHKTGSLRYSHNDDVVYDDNIKGDVVLEYVFVKEASV